MQIKSDNIEIMIGYETDGITEKLFKSFFAKISKRFRKINEKK